MAESKRDNILNAAEQLFASSGFEGTTTRAIAGKADVNIAMLSYYFGSKEQLLYAVLERFSDRLMNVFRDIHTDYADPEQRLRQWLIAYIDYIFEHPNHAKIVYHQASLSQRKEDVNKLVKEFNKIRSIVLDAIKEGIDSGAFRQIDAQLAITSIIAPVNSIVLESNVIRQRLNIEAEPGKLYPEVFKERVKKHMLDVFEAVLLKR